MSHSKYVCHKETVSLKQFFFFFFLITCEFKTINITIACIFMVPEVALGKGEVGDRPKPHLKIRSHPKKI